MTLRFELMPGASTSGTIYPPLLQITYDYVSTSELNKQVPVTFQIVYFMNLDTLNTVIWIVAAVFCFFAFVWAFIRTWIWNRRSGKLAPDMISLFKFTMFLCSGVGNAFFVVLCGVSLYWLIFFKGQNVAFVVVPQPSQQSNYVILIVIAFICKLLDLIHLIFTQSSYDVFFIDWERPRQDASGSGNGGWIFTFFLYSLL
jgi:meckelin